MYETNCFNQIQEIVGIDRVLYEQIMESEWDKPMLTIKRKGDLNSIRNATVEFYSVGRKMSKTGIIWHYYCPYQNIYLSIVA